MSPDKPTVLDLPSGGERAVVIDGKEYTAQFDDVDVLRDLLAVGESIRGIVNDETTDTRAKLDAIGALIDECATAVDRILGEGSYRAIFGGRRPAIRTMVLVTKLEEAAGPAYDEMCKPYLR